MCLFTELQRLLGGRWFPACHQCLCTRLGPLVGISHTGLEEQLGIRPYQDTCKREGRAQSMGLAQLQVAHESACGDLVMPSDSCQFSNRQLQPKHVAREHPGLSFTAPNSLSPQAINHLSLSSRLTPECCCASHEEGQETHICPMRNLRSLGDELRPT